MSYEKFYVEVTLVILLLVLLNGNLTLLQNLSSDIYGKIILIIAICFLAIRYGTTCALLGAFIYLLVNNNYKEGMIPKQSGDNNKPKACSKDRDCGACKYKCNSGTCEASKIDGSEYVKEPFIGSNSTGYDRETLENNINKNPELKKISASCP